MNPSLSPVKIFIAYVRLDTRYLEQLRRHLHPLEQNQLIEVWYDGVIVAGEKWEQHIKDNLEAAQIILLLVSVNSLFSKYFYDQEMKDALARHDTGEAIVIPVILDHCMWDITPLSELQALPKDGLPIEDWAKPNKAYHNVVREVHQRVKTLRAKEKQQKAAEEEKIAQLHPQIQKLLRDMVFIEGGTFQMGGDRYDDEKPIHPVTVSSFEMAKYPVTQAQWRVVMGSDPPELWFEGCDDCPVEQVSWEDCKEFVQKLNVLTGKTFRLPSEAEWEFAARGGKKSQNYLYAGSDDIEEVAWYRENSDGKTHPVGRKKANELGVYDMSGNVWEWCEDDWHESYNHAPNDGRAWVDTSRGSRRVLRGGSWGDLPNYCRSAYRLRLIPNDRDVYNGFRCAKTP